MSSVTQSTSCEPRGRRGAQCQVPLGTPSSTAALLPVALHLQRAEYCFVLQNVV